MELRALLLGEDRESVDILRRLMLELEIGAEMCADPAQAADALRRQKYDAVVVDCDDLDGGGAFLYGLRKVPSNRRSIVFAIIHGTTSLHEAFEMGANFVLEKPLTLDRVLRSFRAARGLMLRERRRYYRHPVEMTVFLEIERGERAVFAATNLSEGGIALLTQGRLRPDSAVQVEFDLPQPSGTIHARGEVAWTDTQGRAGIRFTFIPSAERRVLEEWLDERLQEVPMPFFLVDEPRRRS